MLEPEVVGRLMERGTIEVAPLAFMRGRTLNDSFIILDEAQNTTPEQMKMFLTRLGFGSKIVVTGDVTQIDLPEAAAARGCWPCAASSTASPISRSSSSTPTMSSATRSCRTSSTPTSGTSWRRSAAQSTSMAVFCADEQSAIPIDLERWSRLARLVLDDERAPADAEVSLIFVDEVSIADLNERFLGGDGPTDVLAFPIDDDHVPAGRRPDEGGRGPGSSSEPVDPPVVLGDVVLCPAVARSRPPSTTGPSTTSSRCSSCTACSISSATTTPRSRRPCACNNENASCSSASASSSSDRARVRPA